uniref:Uncharacterized protein n=1 Tax=Anguilla anguilla TaxID=7936 RepID=A0A0E9QWI0_ANGAN
MVYLILQSNGVPCPKISFQFPVGFSAQ